MDFEKISQWYDRQDVKFEITKQLYNREFALLVPSWCDSEIKKRSTRMLKCHNTQGFDFILKALDFKKKQTPYNFYYSLAKYYGGIPNQTLNFIERKKSQANEEWKDLHEYHMKQFDLLIDIDSGSHEDIDFAYLSTQNIITLLDDCNTPYILRFSGKGFHIIIPSMYMPKKSRNTFDDDSIYMLHSRIARKLHDTFSEMIDLSIYDSRRLCKLSYSLANYKENTYVCYPFNTKQEFNDFKLNDYNLNNFDKPIIMRGHFIFNQTGMTDELIKRLGVM